MSNSLTKASYYEENIAFDAKSDYQDLPNKNIYSIAGITNNEITLKKPLKMTYPANTMVRQHKSGSTYMYSAANYSKVPDDKWVTCSGIVSNIADYSSPKEQWWKGTKNSRIIILTTQKDLMFKDIKLEIIE